MQPATSSLMWTPLLALLLFLPAGVAAQQELPIRAAAPAHPLTSCPADRPELDVARTDGDRAEARQMAEEATEAALLGDPERARDLLLRATRQSPGSADLAYRRARAHDELEETESAIRWYCRYLSLVPGGEDASEVQDRLRELQEGLPAATTQSSLRHFREGVDLLEAKRPTEAERRFTEALEDDPDFAGALYNRGVARGASGRTAAAARDLKAYLQVRPDAPDRQRVEAAVQFLENPPRAYDPGVAFALGAAVPGAGHFYMGQPLTGGLFLGIAVGAGLTAAFYEEVDVSCLTIPENGVCPSDQVLSEDSRRPALIPGVVIAALTAGVSAITAYRGATSRNEDGARLRIGSPVREAGRNGLRILSPGISSTPRGVAIEIVRLRF